MSEIGKPREFWIHRNMNNPNKYSVTSQKPFLSEMYVHVREVVPNEPDWKALAQELAEALRTTHSGNLYAGRIKADEALAKYESAVSDE